MHQKKIFKLIRILLLRRNIPCLHELFSYLWFKREDSLKLIKYWKSNTKGKIYACRDNSIMHYISFPLPKEVNLLVEVMKSVRVKVVGVVELTEMAVLAIAVMLVTTLMMPIELYVLRRP